MTIRNITYEDLTGTLISPRFQFYLCGLCNERDYYSIVGRLRREEGELPQVVETATGEAFKVELKLDANGGGFRPRKRGLVSQRTFEKMIDEHLTSDINTCVTESEDDKIVLEQAKTRIKEKRVQDQKGKTFMRHNEGYPEFKERMTARELNTKLKEADNIYNDIRYIWTETSRISLLTTKMNNDLSLKIKTDYGKDPLEHEHWTYEDLAKAITHHAVITEDPMKIARKHCSSFGPTADIALKNIEEVLESLIHATQGVNTELINENIRKPAQQMFKEENVKEAVKWLWLRASLPQDIADKVRTHEIANQAGLGLTNKKLLEHVRQIENKSKSEGSINYA